MNTQRRWRVPLVAAALLMTVVVISMTALSTLRNGRVAVVAVGPVRSAPNGIDALFLVRDIDTVRQEAKLRLYIEPKGRLADASGRFARTVALDWSNESIDATGRLPTAEKGSATLIADFVTTFRSGEEVSYPFDRYKGTIWLEASTEDGIPIPISVRFEAADSTFRYDVVDVSDGPNPTTTPAFELIVERSGLTKGLALIIVAVMWALAVAVGWVTWFTATRPNWRMRSFEILGWLAAMLFALIQLRGVAPGVPGFGTLFDFIGFFWAELITAVALVVIVALLIRSEISIDRSQHDDQISV